jgi:hypothetical protein
MISSKIFRSRWSALIWAGGILWTAYDVASASPQNDAKQPAPSASPTASADQTDATGATYTQADVSSLANAMGN